MMRRLGLLLFGLLAAWPAWAELPAAAAMSPFLLLGTVTAIREVAPANPYGSHLATVQVTAWLKGATLPVITVCYPGADTAPEASADGIPRLSLVVGAAYLFPLAGGAPFRFTDPLTGPLPATAFPALQAALTAYPLTLTLTPDAPTVTAGGTLSATVRMTNTGAVPLTLSLPRDFAESIRFWSWTAADTLPDQPLRMTVSPVTSACRAVTLQPGEWRESRHRLRVLTAPRLHAAQPVSLAAWVYLPGDGTPVVALASTAVTVQVTPVSGG